MAQVMKKLADAPRYRLVVTQNDSLWAWINAKNLIAKAIELADHWDVDDVLHAYIDGRVLVALVYDETTLIGVMVVEVISHPKKRVCYIQGLHVTGPRNFEWFDEIWEQTQIWALEMGCTTVSASGRVGWLRKMPGARDLNMWEVPLQ